MNERQYEAAITPEELETILRHSTGDALLVGGQALALWAVRYNIEPTGKLAEKITSDADFLGSRAHAKALGRALNWKVWLSSMDDGGGQTGKVTKALPDGGIKQVDYLSGIVGLDTARIQKRAVQVTLPEGASVRVLHPLDVLESRLRNLQSLPSKQNNVGVAQARLAIAIARAFLTEAAESTDTRTALSAVERIAKMAMDQGLVAVAMKYQIDPLDAIPLACIGSARFREQRWPQILAEVAKARRTHANRQARSRATRATKPMMRR